MKFVPEELVVPVLVGWMRYENVKHLKERYKSGAHTTQWRNVLGAIGEFTVAVHFNLPEAFGGVDVFKDEPDLPGIGDVKTTRWSRETATLDVQTSDPRDHGNYYLVAMKPEPSIEFRHKLEPYDPEEWAEFDYEIVGWMSPEEIMQDKYLRPNVEGEGYYYSVPATDLHDL